MILLSRFFLLLAAGLFLASPLQAASLNLGNEGVEIDAASLGKFVLAYPAFIDPASNPVRKLREKSIAGGTATLRYEGNTQVEVTPTASGEVRLKISNPPIEAKTIALEMLIPIGFNQGGNWQIGETKGEFPKEKPAKPHLFQANATQLRITNYEGRSLVVKMPDYTFLQLTDNREWSWATFHYRANIPLLVERPELVVAITSEASAEKATPLVDQFGQSSREDWPDKVKSLEELRTDVAAEKTYYDGLKPPARDEFGGLPGSKEKLGLKATGYFHLEKKGDRWILVDPAGNAFFHLGLCGINPNDDFTLVQGREAAYEWIPAREGEFATTYRKESSEATVSFHLANMIRKYGEPYSQERYTARMISRMRAWGFNSGGAFTELGPVTREKAQFPFVAHLPINAWEGVSRIPGIHEVWDPFDDVTRAKMEENMARVLPAQAKDPLIIGYFIVNEPIYENIPHLVPTLKGTHACKRRLVTWLSEKYKTPAAFSTAWGITAASFEELADRVLHVETDAAKADMKEYTALFLDEYFRFIATVFKKYDQNHLLMGSRLMPGTIQNEQLCRIMGRYVDVMSFNYYTMGLDTALLKRVHEWTGGLPLLLSEFYWSSARESGLTGGREVATQQERGLAYRNYVEQSAALGFVVGIEWFTLVDQAVTGRWFQGFDGERANTGVLSVTDRPWKTALNEMMKTNYDIYAVWFGERKPFVWDDPRFQVKP